VTGPFRPASLAPLLDVRDLAIDLGGYRPVRNVTFSIEPGACLGLVGETGCGKSMTCRAIIGLLPRIGARVSGGEIRFQGTDLAGLSAKGWRKVRGRGISFVPQSSMSSLNPVRSVGSQLTETIAAIDRAAEPKERARGWPARRAIELLTQVHIDRPVEVLRRYPHELSGGMRQRVMIALALAGRPKLLVADEPTTALDVTVQREILALLKEIRATTGMALLLVSHDLGVVRSVADTVAVMYAGMLVETGPAAEVIAAPRHPYTGALINARPTAVAGSRLQAIPGSPPGRGDDLPGCPFAPRCQFAVPDCGQEVPALAEISARHSVACWRAAAAELPSLAGSGTP
jgi:oligopeptide/dipeptide ABC transporter ATP-binding protein